MSIAPSSQNLQNEQEQIDNIQIQLNSRQIGIIQTVTEGPLSYHQLRIVYEVYAEKQSPQACIDQLHDRIPPEYRHDPEYYQYHQDHHQVRTASREISFCHTFIILDLHAYMVSPITRAKVIPTASSTVEL